MFGTKVEYNEIFAGIRYVNHNSHGLDAKAYEGTTIFEEVRSTYRFPHRHDLLSKPSRWIKPMSYRKIFFVQESGEGIVIGQTTKAEGLYNPGDDEGQAWLTVKKKYSFWIVATGINETVLVPKDKVIIKEHIQYGE